MALSILGDWAPDPLEGETDSELISVFEAMSAADQSGERVARLMRRTLDQLYDGQRTGRYSWAQLHKTERTHFGTLFEINLRREFDDVIDEGVKLDYRISGHDVDCKFSQKMYGWMIPPEAIGHLLIVGFVDDAASEFAFGIVRATREHCREAANRDAKVQLNPAGREAVRWLQRPGVLPPNVLLECDDETLAAIFAPVSGQKRINELLRRVSGRRIGRNTIATVGQQDDFMRRVRVNGGARTPLATEGIVVLGGDYQRHRDVARDLGIEVPQPGEIISVRLAPATEGELGAFEEGGRFWRVAVEGDAVVLAPHIPYAVTPA